MSPAGFVQECQRRGIRLRVEGERIRAVGSPPPRPAAFVAYLSANKAQILEWLRQGESGEHLPRPESQSALPGAPARFASTEPADRSARGAPGPEAACEAATDEEGTDTPEENRGAPPLWLRACAPPPGWTPAQERAHRAAWQEGSSPGPA